MSPVTIGGVAMSLEVARTLEAAGMTEDDVERDLNRLRRRGLAACDSLLLACLEGAEDDTEECWREYVIAVWSAT